MVMVTMGLMAMRMEAWIIRVTEESEITEITFFASKCDFF